MRIIYTDLSGGDDDNGVIPASGGNSIQTEASVDLTDEANTVIITET